MLCHVLLYIHFESNMWISSLVKKLDQFAPHVLVEHSHKLSSTHLPRISSLANFTINLPSCRDNQGTLTSFMQMEQQRKAVKNNLCDKSNSR